ncbi:hypothetical protein ACS0TY_017127 [Phlomoides rotata]
MAYLLSGITHLPLLLFWICPNKFLYASFSKWMVILISHGVDGAERGLGILLEGCGHSMRNTMVKGNKCDNGFKSGYLLLLENVLAAKFSGTDLKGEPHIT